MPMALAGRIKTPIFGLSSIQQWVAFLSSFAVSVAFWPGISGAATSPRWAIAALSLYFLDWRCIPFIAWCFYRLDLDSAVHWAIVCAAFGFGRSVAMADLADATRQRVITAFCVGIAVSGGVAAAQSFGWQGIPQVVSPAGLFINKNFMGEAACLAIIAALASRLYWPALICAPALLLSTSRASWIAFGLGCFWLCPSRWRLPFLAAVLIVGFSLWWMGFGSSSSLIQRLGLWHDAILNLHWLGNGNYDYSTVQYREPNLHNDWLQLIYELGIVGLIPVAVLFRSHAVPFIVALVVIGSFGFPLHMPATAWFAAFIVGASMGQRGNSGRNPVRAGNGSYKPKRAV